MKHSSTCKMSFGRKDKDCPRCQELLNGAEPIKQDWRKKIPETKYKHDCAVSNCGVVCTYGEW